MKKLVGRGISMAKKVFLHRIIEGLAFLGLVFIIYNWVNPLQVEIPYSTLITDREGTVIHAYLSQDDKWRMRIASSEVSELLKKAFIEKEDKYFHYHPGVNPLAITRAFVNNIWSGKRTSGASTITMQVIRLLHPRDRTYANKLLEVVEAFQLEMRYSKEEILNLYLNLVPYGGNVEGVKAVALLYLGKLPQQLSLSECVALSVIPNRPNSLRPGKHNDRINTVKNQRLLNYQNDAVFDSKEVGDALLEDFKGSRQDAPRLLPHLSRRLKKKYRNIDYIQTTIDLHTQDKVEKLTRGYSRSLAYRGIYNAAVVVVDNHTQQVLAYLGSSNFDDKDHSGQVDGVMAIRSPGSTLKPFLYGLMMEAGYITPMTKLMDVPMNVEGYEPENYDGEFHGSVTARHALSHSLNIPAVRLLDKYSAKLFATDLARSGFKQIQKDQSKLGLSMILGGCGVSLENLCGLYTSFANEGVSRPLVYCDLDTTEAGDTLLSPEASYLLSKILLDVSRPDLPDAWRNTLNMPAVAWKTGTSYGRKDAWSIGYNDALTIGVWVGNFDNRGVPELSGAASAAPLLFQLFNAVSSSRSQHWLARPEGLGYREVCSITGMVPETFCQNLVVDDYIPGWSSAMRCDHQKKIWVNPDSTITYCLSCRPEVGYVEALYDHYPQELVSWFEKKNINYMKMPLHNPECERIFYEGEPKITSPVNRLTYYIDVVDSTEIALSCQVYNDVEKVYWYINDQLLQEAVANEEVFYFPKKGSLKVTCVDDKGRKSSVECKVRYANF